MADEQTPESSPDDTSVVTEAELTNRREILAALKAQESSLLEQNQQSAEEAVRAREAELLDAQIAEQLAVNARHVNPTATQTDLEAAKRDMLADVAQQVKDQRAALEKAQAEVSDSDTAVPDAAVPDTAVPDAPPLVPSSVPDTPAQAAGTSVASTETPAQAAGVSAQVQTTPSGPVTPGQEGQ